MSNYDSDNSDSSYSNRSVGSQSDVLTFKIRELDLEKIAPCTQRMNEKEYGGAKIAFIGKGGSGKSMGIMSLLYSKKHIFPVGMVMSGTEGATGFFKKYFPSIFVYNDYDEEQIDKLIKRQKIARSELVNPWSVLVLDDLTDNKKIFRSKMQATLLKNSRHYKLLYILAMQNPMDLGSDIRNNLDAIFIYKETSFATRKVLWEQYASMIPKEYFNQVMDQITNDYTALVIVRDPTASSWTDQIFWYKAKQVPSNWKFGAPEYKQFHLDRYNEGYVEGF